ncbi:MAG: WxL protein peptidoglycan domain-containing protein [Microthrixaceae bacterium]
MPPVRSTAFGPSRSAKPGGIAAGLCVLVSVFVAVTALATVVAAAQTADTFGVEPAPGSSVESGYFSLQLAPGGQSTQAIRVSNETGKDADVRLAAVDATTAQQGGVAYGATGSTPTVDGAWIALDKTEVRLPAGTSQDITFEVSVPPGARPGVHLAGIIAYSPQAQTTDTVGSAGGAGAALYIESRRALAVQILLPGPAAPRLVVAGVTTQARPNGLNLMVGISNDGNGLTKGRGHLTVSGPSSFSADFDIDTVVPATSFTYPVVWTKAPVSGTYQAKVVIDYGNQRAEWEGGFEVGAAEQADLENRVVPSESTPGAVDQGGPPLALTMVALVAVVAVVTCLAMYLRRRQQRPIDTPPHT